MTTQAEQSSAKRPWFRRLTDGSSYSVIDFVLDLLSVVLTHH
jgi:hypothetical protein